MKKFLIVAIALLTSVLTMEAYGYQGNNYRGGRDFSMYANRYDRFGREGVYMGLRLGPSFTTVDSDDKALDGGSTQTGLNFGVFTGMQLSPKAPVFLEGGLMYVEKGGKNLYEGKKITYSLRYLELPIVVKYGIQINEHFSVQPLAGGYFALGIGGKSKNFADRDAVHSFSKHMFKHFDGGLRFGCGVTYDLFYADLTYDLGLANICHDEFDTSHNRSLSLSLGVNF